MGLCVIDRPVDHSLRHLKAKFSLFSMLLCIRDDTRVSSVCIIVRAKPVDTAFAPRFLLMATMFIMLSRRQKQSEELCSAVVAQNLMHARTVLETLICAWRIATAITRLIYLHVSMYPFDRHPQDILPSFYYASRSLDDSIAHVLRVCRAEHEQYGRPAVSALSYIRIHILVKLGKPSSSCLHIRPRR